jgi:hypothetical protein
MKTNKYDELVKEIKETYVYIDQSLGKLAMRNLKSVPMGIWDGFKRKSKDDLCGDLNWFAFQHMQNQYYNMEERYAYVKLMEKTENVADPEIRQMYRQVLARIPEEDWKGFEIKRAQWDRINLKRGKSALDRMIEHANIMTEKNRDKAPDIR